MTSDYLATLNRLLDGSLDPEIFSHRDHVGITFEAVARHEFFEAAHILATGLRNLATRAGVPEKFNATITLAFMSLIAERMHGRAYETADAFIEGNPDLLEKSVLKPWYSTARLQTDLSRAVPLLPEVHQPV